MDFKFLKKIFKPTADTKKFSIKSSDIFLVSYPKSGNTWLRFLLGNYISSDIVDFTKSSLVIPDIDSNPEQINHIKTTPRFIKSHFTYTADYPNVIYIIRDGRDVAVSYYYHQILTKEIDEAVDFKTYFYDFFMNGKSKFGSWGDHVTSWKSHPHGHILFIKYEDMLAETEKLFKQILQFSNMKPDNEKAKKAIDISSFKSMQKTESLNHDFLIKEHKFRDNGQKFVRKGISGDWANHFDEEMLAAFNSKYASLMQELGYK